MPFSTAGAHRLAVIWMCNRLHGNYPETLVQTGFEEINGNLLEADFWPGTISGLPPLHVKPGALLVHYLPATPE